jgi:hypothetical protein
LTSSDDDEMTNISLTTCSEVDVKQQFKLIESEYTPDSSNEIAFKNQEKCIKPNLVNDLLEMGDCDQLDAIYSFTKKSNNDFDTTSVEHSTRWCFELSNGSSRAGNSVQISKCDANWPQTFFFSPNHDDTFHILSASNPIYCFENSDNKIILRNCDVNNANQRFTSLPMTLKPIPSEFINVQTKEDNKCLTNVFGPPEHADCDKEKLSNRQGWKFTMNNSGTYSITTSVNFALSFYDSKMSLVKSDPTTQNQQWYVLSVDDTYYTIVHAASRKCLDYNENLASLGDCKNSDRQKIVFEPSEVLDMRPGWHMLKHTKTGMCLRNSLEKSFTYGPCDPNDDSYVYYIVSVSAMLNINTVTGIPLEIRDPNSSLVAAENRINSAPNLGIFGNIFGLNAMTNAYRGAFTGLARGWSFYPGYYMQFNMKNVGADKCIEIDETQPDPYLADCKYADPSQSFEIIQKGRNVLPKDFVQIVNANTKKCLKAGAADIPVVQVDCGDQSDQDTLFKIQEGVDSGYYFEASNGISINMSDSDKIFTEKTYKNDYQSFLISPYGTNYMFISYKFRKCFEPASADNNANYLHKKCELKDLQYYYFVPVLPKSGPTADQIQQYQNLIKNFIAKLHN